MKMGQALSVFEAALPEELAGPYRAALTKLQEAAPPLPAASVHKVLAEQLGPRLAASGSRSSTTSPPRRPASARCTGRLARRARRSRSRCSTRAPARRCVADLNQLGRFAGLFKAIQPGLDVKPLVAELRDRVTEELDYELEAERADRRSRTAYDDDHDICVPQVRRLRAEGARHRVDRRHAAVDVIASGTVEQRDRGRASHGHAALLRARPGPACCTPTRTRATSGCCPTAGSACSTSARWPGCPAGIPSRSAGSPGWPSRATPRRSSTACGTRASSSATRRSTPQAVLGYIRPMLDPVAGREFRFTRAWLRAEAGRLANPQSPAYQMSRQLNLPPSYMLIHRVTLGSIGVLCQLEAEAPYREIVERWLPGFAAADSDLSRETRADAGRRMSPRGRRAPRSGGTAAFSFASGQISVGSARRSCSRRARIAMLTGGRRSLRVLRTA